MDGVERPVEEERLAGVPLDERDPLAGERVGQVLRLPDLLPAPEDGRRPGPGPQVAVRPAEEPEELVEPPLLGQEPGFAVWAAAIIYSLGLCAIAWAFFVRARGRVTFWI